MVFPASPKASLGPSSQTGLAIGAWTWPLGRGGGIFWDESGGGTGAGLCAEQAQGSSPPWLLLVDCRAGRRNLGQGAGLTGWWLPNRQLASSPRAMRGPYRFAPCS